jgi:hypothetical protein
MGLSIPANPQYGRKQLICHLPLADEGDGAAAIRFLFDLRFSEGRQDYHLDAGNVPHEFLAQVKSTDVRKIQIEYDDIRLEARSALDYQLATTELADDVACVLQEPDNGDESFPVIVYQ